MSAEQLSRNQGKHSERVFSFWGFPKKLVIFFTLLGFNNSNAFVLEGFEPVNHPRVRSLLLFTEDKR